VVLPYTYWSGREWARAFNQLHLTVETRRETLGLYPWPASLIFERGLHFVARLRNTHADSFFQSPPQVEAYRLE
jgi:hypothetical protein